MKLSFEKIRKSKLTKKDYLKIPVMSNYYNSPVIMTYWSMYRRNILSLLLITKRGTEKNYR
ncbi:MAG: hypothetical protein CM1200mP11_2090 [Nitrosopumilaceae archaeon]|nr:MAG: hypothetical protein CM1200mP11_2090 [Nitrosopumilaceae archaeon]